MNIIKWVAKNGGLSRVEFVRYTGADFIPQKQKFYIGNANPKARKVIKETVKTYKHKWDKKINIGGEWFTPFPVEGGNDFDSLHQMAIADNAIDSFMELDDFAQMILDCFNGHDTETYQDIVDCEIDINQEFPMLPVDLSQQWKIRVKAGNDFITVGTSNDLNEAKQLLFAYPNEVKKITRY